MANDPDNPTSRFWQAIVWTLRVTVALQCLGNWRWLTQIGETPLLEWLLDPADVGGLAWSESTALAVQHSIGWLVLAAGVFTVCRPCAAVLGPLVLLQTFLATAMWRIDDGFALEVVWLPPQLTALFPYATQSSRIVAPLALMLLDPWRAKRPLSRQRVDNCMYLMRWAIALTFFAHGIEAWHHHYVFTDLLIVSAQRLLGIELTQASAEQLLSLIGAADMVVAVVCVATRWRAVLWWMAFWGAVTAISRIVGGGWGTSMHAMLTRAPHVGLPLAVVLSFCLVESRLEASTLAEKKIPNLEGSQRSASY